VSLCAWKIFSLSSDPMWKMMYEVPRWWWRGAWKAFSEITSSKNSVLCRPFIRGDGRAFNIKCFTPQFSCSTISHINYIFCPHYIVFGVCIQSNIDLDKKIVVILHSLLRYQQNWKNYFLLDWNLMLLVIKKITVISSLWAVSNWGLLRVHGKLFFVQ
jgi:hypothetical protein